VRPGSSGPFAHQQPRLEHGPPDLLDVEGDATGGGDDPVDDLCREARAATQRRGQLAHVSVLERFEGDGGDLRRVLPVRNELGTRGEQHEHRHVGHPTEEPVDGVERGRVAPLEVLEAQDQWAPTAEGDDPRHEGLDGAVEPELAAEGLCRGARDPQ